MTRTIQTTDTESSSQATFAELFRPVAREMSLVEGILEQELQSDAPYVDELLKYGCHLGGKRLRPALLLMAGMSVGPLTDEHLLLGAVAEMIHTATLVHDDVLDNAVVRRHGPSANQRWGNQASVLLGDYLFTHAFYLASQCESTFACQMIGRTTNIVCEGELRQVGTCGDLTLTEEEYLEIIDAKTAELCACCCLLGAHYGGAEPSVVESLTRYGRALGMAFQIADDLLDFVGDESSMGKSLGTDADQRKPTLPLIHTYRMANRSERVELSNILDARTDGDLRLHLLPWLEQFDAIQYTRRKAQRFAAIAREEIAALPADPTTESLRALTKAVIHRAT